MRLCFPTLLIGVAFLKCADMSMIDLIKVSLGLGLNSLGIGSNSPENSETDEPSEAKQPPTPPTISLSSFLAIKAKELGAFSDQKSGRYPAPPDQGTRTPSMLITQKALSKHIPFPFPGSDGGASKNRIYGPPIRRDGGLYVASTSQEDSSATGGTPPSRISIGSRGSGEEDSSAPKEGKTFTGSSLDGSDRSQGDRWVKERKGDEETERLQKGTKVEADGKLPGEIRYRVEGVELILSPRAPSPSDPNHQKVLCIFLQGPKEFYAYLRTHPGLANSDLDNMKQFFVGKEKELVPTIRCRGRYRQVALALLYACESDFKPFKGEDRVTALIKVVTHNKRWIAKVAIHKEDEGTVKAPAYPDTPILETLSCLDLYNDTDDNLERLCQTNNLIEVCMGDEGDESDKGDESDESNESDGGGGSRKPPRPQRGCHTRRFTAQTASQIILMSKPTGPMPDAKQVEIDYSKQTVFNPPIPRSDLVASIHRAWMKEEKQAREKTLKNPSGSEGKLRVQEESLTHKEAPTLKNLSDIEGTVLVPMGSWQHRAGGTTTTPSGGGGKLLVHRKSLSRPQMLALENNSSGSEKKLQVQKNPLSRKEALRESLRKETLRESMPTMTKKPTHTEKVEMLQAGREQAARSRRQQAQQRQEILEFTEVEIQIQEKYMGRELSEAEKRAIENEISRAYRS